MKILALPHTTSDRTTAIVEFPGDYIAEVHSVAGGTNCVLPRTKHAKAHSSLAFDVAVPEILEFVCDNVFLKKEGPSPMRRCAVAALCFASLLASSARGQKTTPQPIHVAAGTVLVFHIQTRLHASRGDEADTLPKGTVILLKLLAPIDSGLDHDGAEFRGYVVSPITSGNGVVIHAQSEVRGILALLRSRAHPEGFRYDLLVTSVTDQGKSYDLTASLNSSFFDGPTQTAPVSSK